MSPPAGAVAVFQAAIPGSYTTTEGVDYSVSVSEGAAVVSTPTYHVTVVAPVTVVHAPAVTALPGKAIALEALVPCSSPTCTATLYWRRTASTFLGEPPWQRKAMVVTGPAVSVAGSTVRRFMADIPGGDVTVAGVDYLLQASDGPTDAYSPGTAYTATATTQMNGQPLHFFHVHVAEPVRIVHVPPPFGYPGEPLDVTATVNCATRTCSGTMGYRRSGSVNDLSGFTIGPFTPVPMTATVDQDLGDAGTVVTLSAEVPAADVTTLGVDYELTITDGTTHSYYPGTTYLAGWGSIDGFVLAWHHVEVLGRPQIAHIPQPTYTAAQPFTLTAQVTAATGAPTVTLRYRPAAESTFRTAAMTVTDTGVISPAGTVYTATYTLPSAFTATAGQLTYAFDADDGYQTTSSPSPNGPSLSTAFGYVSVPGL